MNTKKIAKAGLLLLWVINVSCSSGATTQNEKPQSDPVDQVLEELNTKSRQLTSFEGQIEHNFKQPVLFDAQTLRKGILYYTKIDNKPKLRLNFQTIKEDEEDEQEHQEEYIILEASALDITDKQFKGTWLAHIDYPLEQAKYYQLTEYDDPNQPMDVFELVSNYIPIVGFTKIEDLKKEFDVSLIEQEKDKSEDFIQVHLAVKPNSVYKDKYEYIDCWIDKTTGLPAEIVAITTEEDIYEIKFIEPKINKKIDIKVFDFKIPDDFSEPEIIPISETTN